jgi:UDP:flavonoid glycosyltransferase YjiC (YdhE family)
MMRVLFTTTAGCGHFYPLVPLAQALEASGHDVAFACARSFCPEVEAMGFRAFPAGRDDDDPEVQRVKGRLHQMPGGPEANAIFIVHVLFGVKTRLMVPDTIRLCHTWRSDVVVRENAECGGAIAAERLGLPHAAVQIGYRYDVGPLRRPIGEQLDRVRQAWYLPPDPDLAMLYRYLLLSFVPPSYRDPRAPVPPTLHALRPIVFDRPGDEGLPAWVAQLPERPTVCVTHGSEMHQIPGGFPDVPQAIVAGLRDEPLNLIVTVGRDRDPAALGLQPPHVHVARSFPHTALLPRCDLVVTPGGPDTVLAAVSAGLPLVVTPTVADQPDNARRCAELGLGRVVERKALTPEAVREAVRDVLREPRYRANVERLRAELLALPRPEYAVPLLEDLAVEKTPQVARGFPCT